MKETNQSFKSRSRQNASGQGGHSGRNDTVGKTEKEERARKVRNDDVEGGSESRCESDKDAVSK